MNLAVAYREMGLHADSIREAAVAVEGRPATATEALRLLVTMPLLRRNGLQRLRERLARQMVH